VGRRRRRIGAGAHVAQGQTDPPPGGRPRRRRALRRARPPAPRERAPQVGLPRAPGSASLRLNFTVTPDQARSSSSPTPRATRSSSGNLVQRRGRAPPIFRRPRSVLRLVKGDNGLRVQRGEDADAHADRTSVPSPPRARSRFPRGAPSLSELVRRSLGRPLFRRRGGIFQPFVGSSGSTRVASRRQRSFQDNFSMGVLAGPRGRPFRRASRRGRPGGVALGSFEMTPSFDLGKGPLGKPRREHGIPCASRRARQVLDRTRGDSGTRPAATQVATIDANDIVEHPLGAAST